LNNCYPSKKEKEVLSNSLGPNIDAIQVASWFKEQRLLCRSPAYVNNDAIPRHTYQQLQDFSDKRREAAIQYKLSEEVRKRADEERKHEQISRIKKALREKLVQDGDPRFATIGVWAQALGIELSECQQYVNGMLEIELDAQIPLLPPSNGREPGATSTTALPPTPTPTLSPRTPHAPSPTLQQGEQSRSVSRSPLSSTQKILEEHQDLPFKGEQGSSVAMRSPTYPTPTSPLTVQGPPLEPRTVQYPSSSHLGLNVNEAARKRSHALSSHPPSNSTLNGQNHSASDVRGGLEDMAAAGIEVVETTAKACHTLSASPSAGHCERQTNLGRSATLQGSLQHPGCSTAVGTSEGAKPRAAEEAVARFTSWRRIAGEGSRAQKSLITLEDAVLMAKEAGEKAARVDGWWKTGRLTHLGFPPPIDKAKAKTRVDCQP